MTSSTQEDALAIPESSILEELMRLVQLGSIFELRSNLVGLKQHNQKYSRFSNTLLQQAKSFNFEEMEELLKEYLGK